MLASDLYSSIKLTKLDSVKSTNWTNNCPEESVKFWMFSVGAKSTRDKRKRDDVSTSL